MSNIFCANCVNKKLSNNPQAFGDSSIQWIDLLERGVPSLCPSCGIIYTVAKITANSPRFSDETRNIAGFICGMFLLAVGVVYFDKLVTTKLV